MTHYIRRIAAPLGLCCLLGACSTAPEAPPAPAPQPEVVMPRVEAAPEPVPVVAPLAVVPSKPAAKPARSAAKPGRANAAAAGATTTTAAPQAAADRIEQPKGSPVKAVPAKPATPVAAAKPAPGPEWLQRCSRRQQSGSAVLCDADSLLAPPSERVQVYVRDPKLARSTPSGAIQVNEGLPRLYRFFVLH
ncbi:hypothetical protein [Uliginosibacterium sp. H1]|uniref:hypothetical protein n=1 Tax=Uliginosibacterium sp. H1 TaxID=3114757 RepID=UPI002E1813DB|nr:hypothetical protein [Uliginosibacterium sp. H1]